jgi:hypothetical protein
MKPGHLSKTTFIRNSKTWPYQPSLRQLHFRTVFNGIGKISSQEVHTYKQQLINMITAEMKSMGCMVINVQGSFVERAQIILPK